MSQDNTEIYKYFFNSEYQKHNIARLQHLESLKLDLDNKKVIEFGAGVGDHSIFYLFKNCQVLATDARKELVEFINERFGIDADVIDAEKDQEKIKNLSSFDVAHCYGFLYHINNPEEFLDLIKNKAKTLLLETCVSSDKKADGVHLTMEHSENLSQAISGTGCRPTRNWIMKKLKENYEYVYVPKTQPKHEQFPLDWNADFPQNNLVRAIFIASHEEIDSPFLQTELPTIYQAMDEVDNEKRDVGFGSDFAKISYSQSGEDLIISYIFSLRGIALPTYIDIGANHPWFINNTAFFYKKGCRGINIEPNPDLISIFKKERPMDESINVGISNTANSQRDFYVLKDCTLSTFSKEEADSFVSHGKEIEKVVKIKTVNIQEIIREYKDNIFPDFLSIDVEGLELEILQGIDYDSNYPKVICVETAKYSPIGAGEKEKNIMNFIESKGYYLYADTNLNSIYVKNEFWFKK